MEANGGKNADADGGERRESFWRSFDSLAAMITVIGVAVGLFTYVLFLLLAPVLCAVAGLITGRRHDGPAETAGKRAVVSVVLGAVPIIGPAFAFFGLFAAMRIVEGLSGTPLYLAGLVYTGFIAAVILVLGLPTAWVVAKYAAIE